MPGPGERAPNPRRRLVVLASAIGAVLAIATATIVLWPRPTSSADDPVVVPTATNGAERIVAAVGDSITRGANASADGVDRSYPAQLDALLGDGYDVINDGLPGRTLLDEGAMPYRSEPEFDASHEVGPDIVIIMLGTNDARAGQWQAEPYRRQLASFARSYLDLDPAPAVLLMTPPTAYPNDGGVDPAIVGDQVAPIVREVAAQLGVGLVDIHEVTASHPERFPDGIHPDAEGAAMIAAAVAEAIRALG